MREFDHSELERAGFTRHFANDVIAHQNLMKYGGSFRGVNAIAEADRRRFCYERAIEQVDKLKADQR